MGTGQIERGEAGGGGQKGDGPGRRCSPPAVHPLSGPWPFARVGDLRALICGHCLISIPRTTSRTWNSEHESEQDLAMGGFIACGTHPPPHPVSQAPKDAQVFRRCGFSFVCLGAVRLAAAR